MQKWDTRIVILVFMFSFLATNGHAQVFPQDSPKASITQRIGLHEITISYSRPRVRGREIWNVLVPYGEVWRTGANYPTQIVFEKEIQIEGRDLPAGKYALYSIPNDSEWIIIFSKNIQLWGAFGYKADDDALRVTVKPESSCWSESFTIAFSNVTSHSATLHLRWANMNVPIKIEVNTYDELMRNIENALREKQDQDWGFYWHAAKHLLELNRDLDTAEKWIRKSIQLEKNWMNLWTGAEISMLNDHFEEAIAFGREALESCKANTPYCTYTKVYEKQMTHWSLKRSTRE